MFDTRGVGLFGSVRDWIPDTPVSAAEAVGERGEEGEEAA